jgi:hypothetical protein
MRMSLLDYIECGKVYYSVLEFDSGRFERERSRRHCKGGQGIDVGNQCQCTVDQALRLDNATEECVFTVG